MQCKRLQNCFKLVKRSVTTNICFTDKIQYKILQIIKSLNRFENGKIFYKLSLLKLGHFSWDKHFDTLSRICQIILFFVQMIVCKKASCLKFLFKLCKLNVVLIIK